MRAIDCALLAAVLFVPAAGATSAQDPTTPIRQFIDGFNAGDVKSAFATYASGNVTIVDEFAPHLWIGPHAAQDWAADYEKHAAATGVTDGKVTYGKATRVEITGAFAYVVMPTKYLYNEHGKPQVEEGQITAVLHFEAGAWKMRGWTWTGVKPHTPK
jgi:hypothetical protein